MPWCLQICEIRSDLAEITSQAPALESCQGCVHMRYFNDTTRLAFAFAFVIISVRQNV